jgi:hypothetical protein
MSTGFGASNRLQRPQPPESSILALVEGKAKAIAGQPLWVTESKHTSKNTAHLSSVESKIDTGRRRRAEDPWNRKGAPRAYYADTNPASQSTATALTHRYTSSETLITPRSDNLKRVLEREGPLATVPRHTEIIYDVSTPPAGEATRSKPATVYSGTVQSSHSNAGQQFASPRLRRIGGQQFVAAATPISNEHHFAPSGIPPAPQPLTVPAILLPQPANPTGTAATERRHRRAGSHIESTGSLTARAAATDNRGSREMHPSGFPSMMQSSSSTASFGPGIMTSMMLSPASSQASLTMQYHHATARAGEEKQQQQHLYANSYVASKLAPSLSMGQLPFGISPSDSYKEIPLAGRNGPSGATLAPPSLQPAHSSPNMPRWRGSEITAASSLASSTTNLLKNAAAATGLQSVANSTASLFRNTAAMPPNSSVPNLHAGSHRAIYSEATLESHTRPAARGMVPSSSADSLYPSSFTVEDSSLVADALADLLAKKGLKYKTRLAKQKTAGKTKLFVDIKGEINETTSEEEVEIEVEPEENEFSHAETGSSATAARKKSKRKGGKTISKMTKEGYPRPSWDRMGFSVLARQLPFESLFGMEDPAAKLKRRRKERRLRADKEKEEKIRRAAANEDAVRMAATFGMQLDLGNEEGENTSSIKFRSETYQSPRAAAKALADAEAATRSEALVAAREASNSSHPDGSKPGGHLSVLVPSDGPGVPHVNTRPLLLLSSSLIVDPLNPPPPTGKHSILTAAARVVLRKELHPTNLDANKVAVVPVSKVPTETSLVPSSASGAKTLQEVVLLRSGAEFDAAEAAVVERENKLSIAQEAANAEKDAAGTTTIDAAATAAAAKREKKNKKNGVAAANGARERDGPIDESRLSVIHSAALAGSAAAPAAGSSLGLHGVRKQSRVAASHRGFGGGKLSWHSWLSTHGGGGAGSGTRKVLREADRLRARELFDMLALSATARGNPLANTIGAGTGLTFGELVTVVPGHSVDPALNPGESAAPGGGGGEGGAAGASSSDAEGDESSRGRRRHRAAAAAAAGGRKDPGAATLDLESIRGALKSLGLDTSLEDLAFRLRKLQEFRESNRLKSSEAGVSPSRVPGGAGNAPANGAASARRSSVSPHRKAGASSHGGLHELRLTFTDFLGLYEHLANWDELLTYRRAKRVEANEARKKMQANEKYIRAGRARKEKEREERRAARRERQKAAQQRTTDGLPEIQISDAENAALNSARRGSDPSPPLSTAAVNAASEVPSPRSRSQTLQQSGSLSALSVAGSVAPSDSGSRVDLPFFLWIPAHHRAKNINDLMTLYGQPSRVGEKFVKEQMGWTEKKENSKTTEQTENGKGEQGATVANKETGSVTTRSAEKESAKDITLRFAALARPKHQGVKYSSPRLGPVTKLNSGFATSRSHKGRKSRSRKKAKGKTRSGAASEGEDDEEVQEKDESAAAAAAEEDQVNAELAAAAASEAAAAAAAANSDSDSDSGRPRRSAKGVRTPVAGPSAELLQPGVIVRTLVDTLATNVSPAQPTPASPVMAGVKLPAIAASWTAAALTAVMEAASSGHAEKSKRDNAGSTAQSNKEKESSITSARAGAAAAVTASNKGSKQSKAVKKQHHLSSTSASSSASGSASASPAPPLNSIASMPPLALSWSSSLQSSRSGTAAPNGKSTTGSPSTRQPVSARGGVQPTEKTGRGSASPAARSRPLSAEGSRGSGDSSTPSLKSAESSALVDLRAALAAGAARTEQQVRAFVEEIQAKLAGGTVATENAAAATSEEEKSESRMQGSPHAPTEPGASSSPKLPPRLDLDHVTLQSPRRRGSGSSSAGNKSPSPVLSARSGAMQLHIEMASPSSHAAQQVSKQSEMLHAAQPTLSSTLHARVAPERPTSASANGSAAAASSAAQSSAQQDSESANRIARGDRKTAAPSEKEIMQLTDPIIKASKSGLWEEVLMLIQTTCGEDRAARIAYVNRRDKNGSSAIFHCVWPGHYKVLEVLLYHGADPNIQNNRLNTALHLCCEKGHKKLIKLLIDMGADTSLKNWQNKSCLDVIPSETRVEIPEEAGKDTAAQPIPALLAPPGTSLLSLPAPPLPARPPSAMRHTMMGSRAGHRVAVALDDAADSLRQFVLSCAEEAKAKREAAKAEEMRLASLGHGANSKQQGVSNSSLALALGGPSALIAMDSSLSFTEFANKRDRAAAAARKAAREAALAASFSLLSPNGTPLVDLWELTAEDRRAAGIRGNFFGADRISEANGVNQRTTLGGELLIHTSGPGVGITASQNAMGSYKAQFLQQDGASGELRQRIVTSLVREELNHFSLSELWNKTQKQVQGRKTVVSSSDDLLARDASRMETLRGKSENRENIMRMLMEEKEVTAAAAGAQVQDKKTKNLKPNVKIQE